MMVLSCLTLGSAFIICLERMRGLL